MHITDYIIIQLIPFKSQLNSHISSHIKENLNLIHNHDCNKYIYVLLTQIIELYLFVLSNISNFMKIHIDIYIGIKKNFNNENF